MDYLYTARCVSSAPATTGAFRRCARITGICLAIALCQAHAADQPGATSVPPPVVIEASAQDGPVYRVQRLHLRYLRDHPMQPSVTDIMDAPLTLVPTATGWISPPGDLGPEVLVTRTLREWSDASVDNYHGSALQDMILTVLDVLRGGDLLGIRVIPDPDDITEFGDDLRTHRDDLTLLMITGILTDVRTIGAGDRVREGGEIEPTERINHPKHARILANSPVRAGSDNEEDEERGDLLRRGPLDRYVYFLSRHPGRRVDVSVAAGEEIGTTALDYMITENRPLVIYGQLANTGTPSTGRWRQRFGLFHTQVTNNDDIFSIDYTTANFDDVHAVTASYEAPFPNRRVRWKVDTGYSEYTASDVGIFNDTFKGRTWSASAEVAWNFYQHRELFLDVFGGLRFESLKVKNPGFFIEGSEQLLTPYIGVRLDRTSEWFFTRAAVVLDWQGDLTNVDNAELTALGRTDPDNEWTVLRWDIGHTTYLEPIFNRAAWEDPSTPGSSTLAHEVALSLRGQYAFGNRLIPQAQSIAGGLYTVRGYPQAASAGDNSIIASAEYRLHIPRLFALEETPRELFGQPFRAAPQFVYGTPDWDVVLKAFVDTARVTYNDAFFFEESDTLVSAGIGVDFLYRRNLNLRLDWGFALKDLENRGVKSGDNRLHFVATILF